MEYVSAAGLVSVHLADFVAEVLPLLRDLVDSLVDLSLVIFRLLSVLAGPGVKLLRSLGVILRPLVASLLALAWRAFASQTPNALAKEAAAAAATATVLALEYRLGVLRSVSNLYLGWWYGVSTSYSSFKRNIRNKSAMAAALLSHALFAIPAFGISFFFGPAVDAFAQRWGLFAASFLLPAYRTIAALYSMDNEDEVPNTNTVTPRRQQRRRFQLITPNDGRRANRAAQLLDAEADKNKEENGAAGADISNDDVARVVANPVLEDSPAGRVLLRRRRRAPAADATATLAKRIPSMTSGTPIENGDDDNDGNENEQADNFHDDQTPMLSGLDDDVDGSQSDIIGPKHTSGRVANEETMVSAERRGESITPSRLQTPKCRIAFVERESRAVEGELLRFWVVFGVAWAVRGLVRYFLPAMFSGLTARLDTFLFFFVLWLQLGLTRGANILFPVVATFLRQSHYLRSTASRAEQLNIGLRMIVACGLISTDKAAVLGETIAESGLALLGVVFFITPRSATFLGTILIGYCVPIYLTVSAASSASLPTTRYTWLCYWAVYSLVDTIYSSVADLLDWLPLWYHIKLAIILWLQTPMYRGAAYLLDQAILLVISRVVSMYRRRSVTPRKRKRA
jgi:TB2/DP1, HVA22 family